MARESINASDAGPHGMFFPVDTHIIPAVQYVSTQRPTGLVTDKENRVSCIGNVPFEVMLDPAGRTHAGG